MSEDIQYTLKYKIDKDSTDFKVGDLVVGKDKYESYIEWNEVKIKEGLFLDEKDKKERAAQLKEKEHSKDNLDRDISVIIEIPRMSQIFTSYKVVNIYTKQEKKYDSKKIVKLVLQSKPTGGKRKTIRRKSKNRKTKKKINGGGDHSYISNNKNYSYEKEKKKEFQKIYEEGERNRAKTGKQERDQLNDQKQTISDDELKRNPNQIVPIIR